MLYKDKKMKNPWAEQSWNHDRARERLIEELRSQNFYGIFGKKGAPKIVTPKADSTEEYLERLGYEL